MAALGMVAAGAAAVLWVLPALLGFFGGPVPAVTSALLSAARPPVKLAVAGAEMPLLGSALHFERVTVAEEGPSLARVVSTLDFDGSLGPTRVSSLGRETTRFRRTGARWELEGELAPTLAGAVATLVARARALERGDRDALAALVAAPDREQAMADPALRTLFGTPAVRGPIQAWYLRSEVGEITVTEEAGEPPRPRRLRLVPREPGSSEFVFAGSVL